MQFLPPPSLATKGLIVTNVLDKEIALYHISLSSRRVYILKVDGGALIKPLKRLRFVFNGNLHSL
ncbi:hypothetical protein E2C01_010437 [Portunus trituberculatus]|uniref:Uncharacterized protein n=1 Tax=Portunus trituberculatus TaxID=210409 RepID=A0A5B7D8G7_PORTR|nr:hypothetical protein [Portunus trituberculatus]